MRTTAKQVAALSSALGHHATEVIEESYDADAEVSFGDYSLQIGSGYLTLHWKEGDVYCSGPYLEFSTRADLIRSIEIATAEIKKQIVIAS